MADVRFAWPGRQAFTLAVERFNVARGETVLITGPSGSGKSTLTRSLSAAMRAMKLSLLCGVLSPSEGSIGILGTDLTRLSAAMRDRFRVEHFGIIFELVEPYE